jgi:hypothetical protein
MDDFGWTGLAANMMATGKRAMTVAASSGLD